MSLALALLLCAAAPAADPNANLDFSAGTLDGWEGDGFYVTTGSGHGPSLTAGVCSSDRGQKGRTALLHRTLVVPPGTGVLRCTACAVRPRDNPPEGTLDVIVFAAGRKVIPKRVRKGLDLDTVGGVLVPLKGRPREYVWDLSAYVGQTLRVVLVDEDKRPGCHLACSGFRLVPADVFDSREFSRFMVRLADQNKLAPVARFDSKHFLALSNADDDFTQRRLNNCELIYDLFFDHFRKHGFRLREPAGKLMVAVFDSQAGFEAYLGQPMPTAVTGVYNKKTNRLLVYDYGQNRDFVAARRQNQQQAHRIRSDLDRIRFVDAVNRRLQEFRTEANIGTVMHEVAHQLSFNTGMLNRDGDVPLWLAEGLACYCEATSNSAWQGIGEPNPERVGTLAQAVHGRGQLLPLRELIEGDRWMTDRPLPARTLMGYA
ncbi:MAG TPA: DUF1570 domain-containing protein, partial [Gemmataceae bacterium]|nr:DUF1570 domain-containing protein [Gemmataceae bacterium]